MVLKRQGLPAGRQGFTLVELLIVISIIIILSIIMVGIIDPGALVDKANDARRKKDLSRVKIAFEEYFNDKGCFPKQDVVDGLVCNKSGFSPWLSDWPCDPNGGKYKIVMEKTACPLSYKLYANLKNRNDSDIPSGWYDNPILNYHFGDGSLDRDEANYGTSSSNVTWEEKVLDPKCTDSFGGCYVKAPQGSCQAIPLNHDYLNTYTNVECSPECLVDCCNNGRLCN